MKRGQVGLGLVIFAIVAIIAVIGLVLLFTRASEGTGAAFIGDTRASYYQYPVVDSGISAPQAQPPFQRGQSGQYTPEVQKPYGSSGLPMIRTHGTTHPVIIVGGVDSMVTGPCLDVLFKANVANKLDWYTYPEEGGTGARGFFSPDSSSVRRVYDYESWPGNTGGMMAGYWPGGGQPTAPEPSTKLYREKLLTFVDNKDYGSLVTDTEGYPYFMMDKIEVMNNKGEVKDVAYCWSGLKPYPFPQL